MMDDQNAVLFNMGQIVATPAALEVTNDEERHTFLSRHCRGSWEECPPEDRLSNHRAVLSGEDRIISSHRTALGITVWVITEWDRTVTTLLLPSDY